MLLYHFPLTSSSSSPNLTNKGLKQDYVLRNTAEFSNYGKISSYSLHTVANTNGLQIEIPQFTTAYSLCLRIYINSNQYLCEINGTQIVSSSIGITSTWCDIVLQDNKLYVNGAYKQDVTYSNGKLLIGGVFSVGGTCNCLIQDIRIYDYALSQAEINEYSRALVVHYPLQGNELNPSVLKDVSGFGNDYTLQGNNSYQLDSARGVKSLHTTDTAIYTQTPISSGYTTSFWCKYNGEWKHLCNNGSKYVDGVVNSSLFDTIYATLTASGYDIVDYRVYATALSAEDIKNLYNSPISVSKQHQTMAIEFKENPLYPSKYWRTPAYAEMNYILNTRTNASNLRTLGRVNVNGTYVNGCFLLPDDWVLPAGVTMTIVTNDFTTNTYTLEQFKLIENGGGVFLPSNGNRNGVTYATGSAALWLGSSSYAMNIYASAGVGNWITTYFQSRKWYGFGIRLCFSIQGQHTFSISSASSIRFAPANLQYHCIQHKWRFAEHSYDIIGADNANISDSYNGWIDLFGYGTSGVNYSPTLHTTTNSDYASGDIANTDNDWGINEIQSYDYNVKNFALNKNGIVQHNELRENDSDVNGFYQDKLITNKLIEQ